MASLAVGAAVIIVLGWVLHSVSVRRTQRREQAVQLVTRALSWYEPFRELIGGEYVSSSDLAHHLPGAPDPSSLWPVTRVAPYVDPGQRQRYQEALKLLRDPDAWREGWNSKFVERRMVEIRAEEFRGPMPNLTDSQLQSIVLNEDSNLVLAGAGSGKTTTIVARVGYLLRWGLARADEIIVLAFNKAVAEEVQARLASLGISGVEVKTFHAKGYEVLGEVRGHKPAVSELAKDDRARTRLLQSHFEKEKQRAEFFDRFSVWLVDHRVPQEELDACETPDERIRKERSYDLRSLTGTRLRSQAEVRVADWLTLHSVAWAYERVHPKAPRSPTRRDYTPDFFLPESGIWIEVWACDRHGNLPDHISQAEYLEGLEWKRKVHDTQGTPLVEIFQDDFQGGVGRVLEQKLGKEGVSIRRLTDEERNQILSLANPQVSQFVGLVDTFLNLMRAGGWTPEDLDAVAHSARDRTFLELFESFRTRYERGLADEKKIDFHDMLGGFMSSEEELHPARRYAHVIVDEFQDISRTRLALIAALRAPGDSGRLFAVGDDWQSIYHFTGADPGILVNLEGHVGATERTALDRTFRLTHDVERVSTRFIEANPHQVKKVMATRALPEEDPGVCVRLHDSGEEAEALSWCLRSALAEADGPADVLLLARYNHLLESNWVEQAMSQLPGRMSVRKETIHRAKGLEADFTVVVGLESGMYGFPSEISDDPVLRLVTGPLDDFPNAEERRVFYVALTRTRNRVFLLGPMDETSSFIHELRDQAYATQIEWVGKGSEVLRCPDCRGKTIRRKTGSRGAFWACMNYPQCRGTLPACVRCESGALEPLMKDQRITRFRCNSCRLERDPCPECRKGVLVPKTGRHGGFLGCSAWRPDGSGCNHTRNRSDNGS